MVNKFMQEAIEEAKIASVLGECPVGAVVVKDGAIIGRGHNLCETKNNPILHAEIIAIEEACKMLNNWRLSDCDIYVTLEPCKMCEGAIANAQIRAVYFGAYNFKGITYKPQEYCGIMEDECSALITDFFKELRE
jgi:tRNA(adenine34) deaminase